jgi:hypothetical protein
MKPCGSIFSIIVSFALSILFIGCTSGSEAVDTTGLSEVHLRIEGMT